MGIPGPTRRWGAFGGKGAPWDGTDEAGASGAWDVLSATPWASPNSRTEPTVCLQDPGSPCFFPPQRPLGEQLRVRWEKRGDEGGQEK